MAFWGTHLQYRLHVAGPFGWKFRSSDIGGRLHYHHFMRSYPTWWTQAGSQFQAAGGWCVRNSRRTPVRIALHMGAGLAFLWLFVSHVELGSAIKTVGQAAIAPLAIALGAYACDFLLRAARFWLLLEQSSGRPLPWSKVPVPFIASFGISDLLPLRAGDVFRLLWFQKHMDLRPGPVLGAMMIERFFDLLSLLLLGSIIFALGAADDWLSSLALLIATCSVAALLAWVGGRIAGRAAEGRRGLLATLASALSRFTILKSPRLLLGFTALSFLCWLLESFVMLGAWVSLNGQMLHWINVMAAFVGSTLGTLFPGLPGHFGTFELFGLAIFTRSGVQREFAAAVLLLAHLLLWVPTALFAIFWLPFGKSGKKA